MAAGHLSASITFIGPQAKNVEEGLQKPEDEQAREIAQLIHETQKTSAPTF